MSIKISTRAVLYRYTAYHCVEDVLAAKMLTEEKCNLILAAFCAGHSATQIVVLLKVTVSRPTVLKVIREYKASGKTTRKVRKKKSHPDPRIEEEDQVEAR